MILGKTAHLAVVLACLPLAAPAIPQATSQPEHQQLLNGLRILIWQRPGDQEVLIKLRIHSGGAFDLAAKAGEMALLGELLFPDPATHDYFTEEMGGRLDVDTNYDSMTITMKGRATEFERMVEILRNSLVTTPITPENVSRARDERIKIIRATSISPTTLADRAIGARLFGEFPYGRPYGGSVETLSRVERADLLLARERFLNPNNATLTVMGGVEVKRANRALRQLLGAWRKSERVVPATFRQASVPDSRTLIINAPGDQSAEMRLASRGFARSDPDCPAASLLAMVARKRLEEALPALSHSPLFVRHEAHVLPGMFVVGAATSVSLASKFLETARTVLESLSRTPPSPEEVQQAKSEAITEINKGLSRPEGMADSWLDIDTFGLPSISEQLRGLGGVSASDIQRVASRLFHEAPITSVAVGNSEQLRPELKGHLQVEVMGEIPKVEPNPPANSKPTPRSAVTKPE